MALQIREDRMPQRLALTDAIKFIQQFWRSELSC